MLGNPEGVQSPEINFHDGNSVNFMDAGSFPLITPKVHVKECQSQNVSIVGSNSSESDIAVIRNNSGDAHTEPCQRLRLKITPGCDSRFEKSNEW